MSKPAASNRPLHDLARYDRISLIATVEKLLAEQHHMLTVPSGDLVGLASQKQLAAFVKSKLQHAPSTFNAIESIFKSDGGGPKKSGGTYSSGEDSMRAAASVLSSVLGHTAKLTAAAYKLNRTTALFSNFSFSRAVLSLTEQERGLLRAIAHMAADGRYTPQRWKRFLALLVWNDGRTIVEPSSAAARVPEVAIWLREFLKGILPDHEQFLGQAGSECAAELAKGFGEPAVASALSTGAKWMNLSDIVSRNVYTATRSPASLFLGLLNEGGSRTPIYFDRHESIITIAPPGAGKSQGHVIHNLLHFPGSSIVLDVKGELYQATAEYRSKHFGPVYRFAPTDPTGNTHRYNPLDFVRDDPDGAADDLTVLSYQVVVDNPDLHDPYWEAKGRDFVWAFGMLVCLGLPKEDRKVQSLYELLSLRTTKDRDSPIMKAAQAMVTLGQTHGIPDLVSAGNALQSGLTGGEDTKRIESVLDTARRHLSGFARSSFGRSALSASDWGPETFREKPGSTLYICLDSNELQAYGAIVRLMLAQHALRLLKTQVKPDFVPITFFLDELPKLGNFEFVQLLQELGRSSGLRLWMFAQSMSKLAEAFGRDSYRGLIGNCLVRCFMRPDDEAAEFLSKPLGEINNLFSGERRPLATISDLMGQAYGDKIIVITSGDTPMVLDKQIAVETFPKLMLRPNTVVRRPPPVAPPESA